MAGMVRDMRNRFLVALVFVIAIAIWSPLGKSLFSSTPATPFGMRSEVWQLLLSLPYAESSEGRNGQESCLALSGPCRG
jgi:Cu2+-exporting ATPase